MSNNGDQRMQRRIRWCAAASGVLAIAAPAALALEERYDDLQASVEVAAVFGLSLSNPHLAFQQLSPGTTYTLGESGFYNEVRCRSNTGRPWSLTAQIVSLRHLGGQAALPSDALRWRIASSSGFGDAPGGRGDFESFADRPVVVYRSVGDDERGREAALQFQYQLVCPANAPAGDYLGQIIFTMTEQP